MAVKPLQQSYLQIEEECRSKWRFMSRTAIQCVTEKTFIIFGLKKLKTKAPTLPTRDGSQLVEFKEARKSIADPFITQVSRKNNIYNWTRCTKRVKAVVVPGDGNSLCHAIAVQLCGVIDHVMFFRRCLKETCDKQIDADSPLHKRWAAYTKRKCLQLGKTYSDEGLRRGWAKVYEASSLRPVENRSSLRQSQTTYSPLSEFHIFIMSQITRRPIIVTGPEQNDFKPSIYLPVMIPLEECVNSPIYLSYHNGHFSPLLFIDDFTTATKLRDMCIPITDKNLKPFDFPYLLEGEDGMSLLKRFVSTTGITYTTEQEILEVPAVRVPEVNPQASNDLAIDPNWFIKLCFERLEQGGEPSDVFNLWRFMLELHRIFEEQLPVGLTFDAAQPLSTSLQPENDAEDHITLNQPSPIPTVSVLDVDAADTIPQQMDVDEDSTTQTRAKFLEVENSTGHNRRFSISTSNTSDDSGHSRSNSHNSEESGYGPEEPVSFLLGFLTNPEQDDPREHNTLQTEDRPLPPPDSNLTNSSPSFSIHPEYDDTESDDAGYEGDDHPPYLTSVSSSFPMHSASLLLTENTGFEAAVNSSSNPYNGSCQPPHSRSLLNGVTAHYVSKDEIVIENCKNIVFTVVKLTSQDGNKQVTFTLEKSGLNIRDKVNLIFAANQTLDVHYTHKLDDALDVLKIRLFRLQENLYRLHILLPNTVIAKVSSQEQNLAEALIPENDHLSGEYVDLEDHPFKCRTAGCNGRAIRRYRNLCGGCHEAWREMLNLSAETSASFSYIDSVASVEESNNDGTCEISGCSNPGEARYYGFCESCFHTPAI